MTLNKNSSPPEQADQLQNAADYFLLTKALRPYAIGCLFVGILAVLLGLARLQENTLYILISALGLFVIFKGITALIRPAAIDLILLGVAILFFCISNFFNIFCWALMILTIGLMMKYPRFRNITVNQQTHRNVLVIKKIARAVDTSDTEESHDIIKFMINRPGAREVWKAKLIGEVAVFVLSDIKEIYCVQKENTSIIDLGEIPPNAYRKVTINMGQKSLEAAITPESLLRFNEWKITG